MLSPIERSMLRQEWLEALRAEIERRRAARLNPASSAARESLYTQLELMAQRIRADPRWVEPTDDEKVRYGRDLDSWFRAQGYGR